MDGRTKAQMEKWRVNCTLDLGVQWRSNFGLRTSQVSHHLWSSTSLCDAAACPAASGQAGSKFIRGDELLEGEEEKPQCKSQSVLLDNESPRSTRKIFWSFHDSPGITDRPEGWQESSSVLRCEPSDQCQSTDLYICIYIYMYVLFIYIIYISLTQKLSIAREKQ